MMREPRPPARWSPASLVALAVTALALSGAVVAHVAFLFLGVAPANAVSVHHHEGIDAYVQPEFAQDWKLFAPNPMQRNDAVGVRVTTVDADGRPRLSDWINLTDQDVEAIRGHLAPSHVDQNMLRRAWDSYVATHSVQGDLPKGARGELTGTYLKRVVLQRTGATWEGGRITSMQVAGRFTLIDPPAWSREAPPDTTEYRMLPWWPVAPQDFREL
ncbi:DUF5819 family protein [Streptomyces sp. NPDC007863]|uniref:DUF5819 family protein n=1 Tax=Streptomyces sp. NPDC007863 TaxID=3154894 RepID=UPI0033E14D95